MRGQSWVLCAVVLAGLSGCVSNDASDVPDASSTVDASGGSTSAAAGSLGSIEGIVTNDELTGLSGADVSILNANITVTTDEAGKFSIVNVAPGQYSLVAQKLGYESRGVRVSVEPGVAATVQIALVAIATEAGYYLTDVHSTIMQCMLGSAVWVSSCSWPYEAVYLTAMGAGVNLSSTAGLPPDVMENDWRHPVTADFGVVKIVTEMAWVANTAVSNRMQVVSCGPEYDAVQDSCVRQFDRAVGPSPINTQWDLPKDVRPKAAGEQFTYYSMVWLDWGDPTSDPAATVGVALDQKVDLYNTLFYGEEPEEGFTVLPPSA